MKVVTIVGARPQFIKAAPVSRELRKRHVEILVHTGQHYDRNMSDVFFDELEIAPPAYNLEVGSGAHGEQTGLMLARIERVLEIEKPDRVLLYGDTNSTLSGALAAAKLHIPVCHVEAGLRSFNRMMPEEINRVVADHVADLLLCPSQTAVENLKAEGIVRGVHLVGDVMADALNHAIEAAGNRSRILEDLELAEKKYLLATVHRPENTDDPVRLKSIMAALSQVDDPVVLPLHPRTRRKLAEVGLADQTSNIRQRPSTIKNPRLIPPIVYLDMVRLEQSARMILTDSGGIQKEAYWLGVPCVTLRDETEWIETVLAGWNTLAGANEKRIVELARSFAPPSARPPLYGHGHAARLCADLLDRAGRHPRLAGPEG